MALSNTFSYNPSLGSITIQAFQMCGLRPTSLLQEHMESARMAVNMMLGRWSSQGVNTWQVDLITVPLIQGVKTYDVPVNTITMLDTYITYAGTPNLNNRIILPVSRTEYASFSNPDQQGSVTVFWFDRLLSPTFTLYLTPDGTQPTLHYYRLRQAMDANFTDGQQVELPYYWLEAATFGLAFRLATIWAPERAVGLKSLADESYAIASAQDVEQSDFFVSPAINSYFRN